MYADAKLYLETSTATKYSIEFLILKKNRETSSFLLQSDYKEYCS